MKLRNRRKWSYHVLQKETKIHMKVQVLKQISLKYAN